MTNNIFFTFLTLLLLSNSALAQNIFPYKKNNIKLTLASLTAINLQSLKLGYERHFLEKEKAIETEFGYTYYSREEEASCRGLYSAISYNSYITNNPRHRTFVKYVPFYHFMDMNDYLRYNHYYPGTKSIIYTEYKRTRYKKERYGFTVYTGLVYYLSRKLLFEINIGGGIINYKTTVPDDVDQEYFRNGIFYGKSYTAPNIAMSLKMGYSF